MEESTGNNASTIHRLLGYSGSEFFRDSDNPLPADIIICDEASMLDLFLAKSLVTALKRGARIIFVGDENQLPSVGAGAVLRDIIMSEQIPVCRLDRIYRQTENSFISHNASAILSGDANSVNLTNTTDDFFWIPVPDTSQSTTERQMWIANTVLRTARRLIERGFHPNDIQVLCPMYKGEVGVNALNSLLQNEFNSGGKVIFKAGNVQYRIGDRVMQTSNNYDKDVFNGDQGTIVGFSAEEESGLFHDDDDDEFNNRTRSIYVDFGGTVIEYSPAEMSELTLSYAITIHKAQGSEAKAIIQVVSTSHWMMLQRSILYTGITRAKERCILIGEPQALQLAIKNNKVTQRNTLLTERLQGSRL
jgi:exodeoxyribonuclease V alpha subunit